MPLRLPKTFRELQDIARSQLTNINSMWNAASKGTLDLLNRIRQAFNLASQSDAATVYREALSYAKTSAGEAALGVRRLFSAYDTPLNNSLVDPWGENNQFRYVISFGYDGKYHSFVSWSHQPPTTGQVEQAVADFIAQYIDVYPTLADIMRAGSVGAMDVRLRNAQRLY